MTVPPLEVFHADTCLSCYWRGDSRAHLQVPVYRGMKVSDLRRALHNELNEGAVAGSDERTRDDSGDIGDLWYKRAHAAINRLKTINRARTLFHDLEPYSEDDETVYAFFVFVDKE